MKKNFRNKSNKNFYQLKNLKWTTKEMKINQFNSSVIYFTIFDLPKNISP